MRTELPECKRCCFCFPLRYGLITWGYFKLIAGLVASLALIVTLFILIDVTIRHGASYYTQFIAVISIVLVMLLIDVALNTVFVVGGHSKNVKLLRVYYMYSLVLWGLTITTVLLMGFLMLPTLSLDNIISFHVWLTLLDFSSSFVNIIMQGYFLLLLRSEIIKLSNNCDFRFVNNAAEAECTMRCRQGPISEQKGTEDFCGKETCETEDVCEKSCRTNGACHKNED